VGRGWSVETEGQAVGPGIEGQNVNVRTEAGRLLSARPSGDRQVEVTL
jgi:flagellar basal body P-ring formation protein FlgA